MFHDAHLICYGMCVFDGQAYEGKVINMELLEVMRNRRSVRNYTGEEIPKDKLEQVLTAGLLSASGRNRQPWEFIVVQKKDTLMKLSKSRAQGASMLEHAGCAIVVVADPKKTDVWTEDCSIAMSNMHLMADSLGLGSCWIQGRLREAADGRTTESYIKELLEIPDSYCLEAMLSLGILVEHPEAHVIEELPTEKVHMEKF